MEDRIYVRGVKIIDNGATTVDYFFIKESNTWLLKDSFLTDSQIKSLQETIDTQQREADARIMALKEELVKHLEQLNQEYEIKSRELENHQQILAETQQQQKIKKVIFHVSFMFKFTV